MKELSIEQKAEAYDKALERAREINNEQRAQPFNVMTRVFPELKESEDERIRKALLEMVHDTTGDSLWVDYNVHKEDAIAWLEKQGKNNMGISEATKQELEDNLNKALEKETPESCNKFLEKQGEQKIDPDTLIQQRVDALADIVEEQKPAELPKGEDYGIDGLYHAIRILEETIGSVDGYQSDDGILEHKCAISAVKQLAKQNNAWSEEDEKEIAVLEAYIRSRDWSERHIDRALSIVDELVKKLKSLRPQSRWKPDSSMLICLEYAIKHINKDGDKRILSKLLEQLKKLREE